MHAHNINITQKKILPNKAVYLSCQKGSTSLMSLKKAVYSKKKQNKEEADEEAEEERRSIDEQNK